MACACQGNREPGSQFVIRFGDGTVSETKYPDETSARVALARSGRTGVVKVAR